jgi:hypothetical protein
MGESKIPNHLADALRRWQADPLRPRTLDDEQLITMDHAEWLENFARVLQIPTRAAMTPQRLGTITRLGWAVRYINLLQEIIRKQEEQLIELARQKQDRLAEDAAHLPSDKLPPG